MKKFLVLAVMAVGGLLVAGGRAAQAHDHFGRGYGYGQGYGGQNFSGVTFGGNGFSVSIGNANRYPVGGYGNPYLYNGYNSFNGYNGYNGFNGGFPGYGRGGYPYGGGFGYGPNNNFRHGHCGW